MCAGLVLLVLIPFAQVGWHEFTICDDNDYIYRNPAVVHRELAYAWDYHYGNWHPLTWLSHMADCEMFGPRTVGVSGWAGGHHLMSVAIHAASVVLLFLALRMMTGAFWPSAMVAALFAIHPLRAESVAWAAERKDVLSALFWMLTMLAYVWYARRPHILRYLAVIVALVLGLMSKSMLVTLPCALALLDYWPLRRWRPVDPPRGAGQPAPLFPRAGFDLLWVEKIPMLAIAAGVGWVATQSQAAAGALNGLDGVPLDCRIANALVSYVAYLGKIFWPMNLAIFYPHVAMIHSERLFFIHTSPVLELGFFCYATMAGVLLLAITAAAIGLRRQAPYLIVGWFWYLGTLVPVIGLIQVGIQSMADRYTYIPSIGIYWLVVWGICELALRRNFALWALRTVAAAVLVACLVLTTIQVSYWKNSEALFSEAIKAVPDNYFGYLHLGKEFYSEQAVREGELAGQASVAGLKEEADVHHAKMLRLQDMAADAFKKALKINPTYDFGNNNLAVWYAERNDQENAIKYFTRALQAKPAYPDALSNLCTIFLRPEQKKYAQAVALGERAVALLPEKLEYRLNLGRAYEGVHRPDDAAQQYSAAVQLDPDCVSGYRLLMRLMEREGKMAEAIACCQNLVRISRAAGPSQESDAYRFLGLLYARLGNMEEADKCLQEAVRLAPQYDLARQCLAVVRELNRRQQDINAHPSAQAYCDLGRLHAMIGDWAEAEKCLQQALHLDGSNARARELLKQLQVQREKAEEP